MNKIKYYILLALICITEGIWAQSDFGVWTNFDVKKKLSKRLDATVEGEFRTRNDNKTIGRWDLSTELSYRINSFLKVGGSYNFIRFNHKKRGWETGHRYELFTTGAYHWSHFELSLREKYQHTYRVGVSSTYKRANPKDMLRSRVQLSYNIPKCRFTPYTSVEFYHTLNDPQRNGLEKTRYTIGTTYKINKKNMFEVYYRYQAETSSDNEDENILGIGYTLKF
jgi:hypothetical protein